MIARASAFAALGLEPGADAAAIEQAYRRLIKQYHPDREGGDGTRAAEIIHAYRLLKGGKALIDPLQFNEPLPPRPRSRWPAFAAVALATFVVTIVAVVPRLPVGDVAWLAGAQIAGKHRHKAAPLRNALEEDLHLGAIRQGVADAVLLYHTKDEMALASASRDCHARLRAEPGTALLDRCAAFDDAVVGLEDRDPLRDRGPFATLDVTSRQWSGASLISDDPLAIDSRLDRIRLQVELALSPPAPPPAEPAL